MGIQRIRERARWVSETGACGDRSDQWDRPRLGRAHLEARATAQESPEKLVILKSSLDNYTRVLSLARRRWVMGQQSLSVVDAEDSVRTGVDCHQRSSIFRSYHTADACPSLLLAFMTESTSYKLQG